MTYIENVFICMASPLLIAALCMGRRQAKFFLCCLAGMGACLLSAYINTFFAALYAADTITATAEIAPVVEEVMKLLPLLFYLLVFEPEPVPIKNAAIIVALSFATFENVCYLIQNGAGHFFLYFFPGHWNGCHARDLWCHRRRWAGVCMAAHLAEDRRNLRSARCSHHFSCNL